MPNVIDDHLSAPISELEVHGLSVRSMNRLEEQGLFRVSDLQSVTRESISGMEGLGDSFLCEIRGALSSFLKSSPIDTRLDDHVREASNQEKYRNLAARLNKSAERRFAYYKSSWWPADRALHREAAAALVIMLHENERLWDEVRRLKAGE